MMPLKSGKSDAWVKVGKTWQLPWLLRMRLIIQISGSIEKTEGLFSSIADLSIIITVGVYALSIVDAYVDASYSILIYHRIYPCIWSRLLVRRRVSRLVLTD